MANSQKNVSQSKRIFNTQQFRKDLILLTRLFFTGIGLSFFAYGVVDTLANPYYYINDSLGIYLGHTRILLILAPLFIWFTWRYYPVYAPLLMIAFYGLHEFFFNTAFALYFHPMLAYNTFWIQYLVFAAITAVVALKKYFNPFNTWTAFGSFSFLMWFMIGWIFIGGFQMTYNFITGIHDETGLIPNLFEISFNLIFTFVFLAGMKAPPSDRKW